MPKITLHPRGGDVTHSALILHSGTSIVIREPSPFFPCWGLGCAQALSGSEKRSVWSSGCTSQSRCCEVNSTCRSLESWRVWLAGLCDAACPRCRDPASPRGPAPAAAAAGERVSPRGSLSPRIPPGGSWVPREAGGTGRDRAGPASQSTPRCSVLLPPPGVQLSARVPPARGAVRRSRTRKDLD